MIKFFNKKQSKHPFENLENTFIQRRLSKIAWPLSINTLTFYMLTVIDSMFIGYYDPNGLDILNTIMMPFLALNQIIDYIHMGTVIPAAQAFGEKNYQKAQQYAENGFFVYGITGIIFWLFWIIMAKPIYYTLTTDPKTRQIALEYITIVAFTYLIQGVGYKGCQAVFATTGFTKPFMITGFVQVIVNLIANRVLIYGDFFFPELGIAGAAWGTLLSCLIGALVMFYYFLKQKTLKPTLAGVFTPNLKKILTTIHMGFPVGIDMFLWGIGGTFLVWIINHTDSELNRFMFFFITIPELSFRAYSGFVLAVTNLVGRAFGALNIPKIFKILKFGLRDGLIIALIIGVICLIFPTFIARIFTSDLATINHLKVYIPLMILITVPRAIWEFFNATLHGLGITFWGMFVQFIGLIFITVQGYFYITVFEWGIFGLFLIYIIDEVLRMIFFGARLFYTKNRLYHQEYKKI